jgi:hypothetical protein
MTDEAINRVAVYRARAADGYAGYRLHGQPGT